MNNQISQRVVKRLAAAEGYLELGLPQAALAELARVTETGPFEAIELLLRGEALTGIGQFEEAIEPLVKAAEMFPSPMNHRAWFALARCYEATGQSELAEAATSATHNDDETSGTPGVVTQVIIQPIFTAVLGNQVRQLHR